MRRVTRLVAALATLAVLASVRPAAADTLLTGSIGRTFGGDVDKGHLSYGAALGFLGEGPLGLEVEGTYTPDFFGNTTSTGSNNVTTLMGNALLATPEGRATSGLRLYATGGVGIMKFRVPDIDQFFDVDQSDFAMNAGAGALLRLGDRFGVRGDVRYFRDLKTRADDPLKVDFGKFHYWRGAVGATLRF
jgi:opacity protein-like surface antigen